MFANDTFIISLWNSSNPRANSVVLALGVCVSVLVLFLSKSQPTYCCERWVINQHPIVPLFVWVWLRLTSKHLHYAQRKHNGWMCTTPERKLEIFTGGPAVFCTTQKWFVFFGMSKITVPLQLLTFYSHDASPEKERTHTAAHLYHYF